MPIHASHNIVVGIGGAETLGMAAGVSADVATHTLHVSSVLSQLSPMVLQGACQMGVASICVTATALNCLNVLVGALYLSVCIQNAIRSTVQAFCCSAMLYVRFAKVWSFGKMVATPGLG